MLDMWVREVQYALRQARRSPGFTLTAILTLAMGIGAAVTMYSVVRSVILVAMPYPQPERLMGIAFTFPQNGPNNEQTGSSAEFVARNSRSFEATGITDEASAGENLSFDNGTGVQSLLVHVQRVSYGYFPALRVQPMVGRVFSVEEDLTNGPKAVLISYQLWRTAFNSDPRVAGRVLRLNEESYTVVGVMPASLRSVGQSAPGRLTAVDLWRPLQLSPKDPGYDGDNYTMIGRLRDGVSSQQAAEELSRLTPAFYELYPQYLSWRSKDKQTHALRVWPLQVVATSGVRASLLALSGAVVAVLLVACLNLAGLMTARTSRRMNEFALRRALGAERGDLIRLLLAEASLLALAGAVGGFILSRWMTPVWMSASPLPLVQQGETPSWVAALAALTLACGATAIFGLLPAFRTLYRAAAAAANRSRGVGLSIAEARTGRIMMVAQISVAMVLLSAAFLLLDVFRTLRSTYPGVDTKNLIIAQVTLKGEKYAENQHTVQFIQGVLEELGHAPGVGQIAAINGIPFDRGLNIAGRAADQTGPARTVQLRMVTPGYFRTMGLPLLMGRDISNADTENTPQVVVVSEAAAKRWWPGESAIGKRIEVGGKTERTVIGVVADMHTRSLAEIPQTVVYEPFTQVGDQLTKAVNGWFPTTFAIRANSGLDLRGTVQLAIARADSEIPLARYETMQTMIDSTLDAPRFFSWLAGGFAGFALLLTLIGLFGLLSYQVTQRMREMGVRLAVGATRGQILRSVLERSLLLTLAGLTLGGLGSLAVPRLVSGLLADNMNMDSAMAALLTNNTLALSTAAIAMLVAALAAGYLPARRAAAVEPMQVLRSE